MSTSILRRLLFPVAMLIAPPTAIAAEPAGRLAIQAVPGVERAGRFAGGGRGGDVFHVTNANDSGQVNDGRRAVEVSGAIDRKDNLAGES